MYALHLKNKLFQTIKKNGYHDVVVNKENEEFLKFLSNKGIDKKSLTHESLDTYWLLCLNKKLTKHAINKKLKLFISKPINLKIKFVNDLPVINSYSTSILIMNSIANEFQKYWKEFQSMIYKSEISPDGTAKSDFIVDENWTYTTLIETMPTLDEGNKKRYRQKKFYYLFFLFLTSQEKALLPTQFIMSEDTFYNYSSRLNILIFFQKEHFFLKMPFNKNLIEKELAVNNKAKFINYIRFSYLINHSITLLVNLSNHDIATVMNNLRNSSRSSKMVSVYENPIRKILYWHGALNIDQTKKESDSTNQTPLEILYDIKDIDKRYLEVFYLYFSEKPSNEEQIRYSKNIKSLIIFLDSILPTLNAKNLKNFFNTSINKKDISSKPKLDSKFLQYLYKNISSQTLQQDLQMIVYQSFGNYNEFSGCFTKKDLEEIYKTPRNRKIARLALDKKILTKMKEICIFNPIPDNYYISTHIDKTKYSWEHFDKSEPQLPCMLFLFLSMPWRKEHIISMDRDNFLRFNEDSELIEVQVTTDKNQNNDFVIEKEFFEYAISFKDLNGDEHCPLKLITQTVEYTKESFPTLVPIYRKKNENWGKIKPILCRNSAQKFLPSNIFDGYYYKVFLQALLELDYPYEKISYFIQFTKEGLKRVGDYSKIYSTLESISIGQASILFQSSHFSPHAIRKSNITYLVSDKKSLEFIIKLSGHKALSTVLRVYIDYDMLSRLNINEKNKTAIVQNFRQTSRIEIRKIIENYQKFHTLSVSSIKNKLLNENLFFSPIVLITGKTLQINKYDNLDILEPIFWEDVGTGICTNALNCPIGKEGACSICMFFLSGSNFINSINSKIMQLSSRCIEYFNIILKHINDEHLSSKEAIIYEDELQITLAQLEGYSAIVSKIDILLYQQIQGSLTDSERKNLPIKQDMVIIKYEHVPHLSAQLEIYKYSKQFIDYNIEIEHSIEILYTKIMELILLNELPKDLFIDTINNKEMAVERFLELLDNNNSISIQALREKFLLL
ncbi:MAG: hypothetical protein ACI9RG_000517 [Sulfurimonas sp.]